MKITKTSPISGKQNTMDIDIEIDQWAAWRTGTLIQEAMPLITADEREFIMTGITPSEWAETFGDDNA